MILNEMKGHIRNAIGYLRERPFGQDKIDNATEEIKKAISCFDKEEIINENDVPYISTYFIEPKSNNGNLTFEYYVTDWNQKEYLENDFIEAARILVAFIVQNCEVFEVENAQ